jgi:hypothetical protein
VSYHASQCSERREPCEGSDIGNQLNIKWMRIGTTGSFNNISKAWIGATSERFLPYQSSVMDVLNRTIYKVIT